METVQKSSKNSIKSSFAAFKSLSERYITSHIIHAHIKLARYYPFPVHFMIPVNMDLSHQNLLFESETGQWIHKMQQQNSYRFVLFLFCLQQV